MSEDVTPTYPPEGPQERLLVGLMYMFFAALSMALLGAIGKHVQERVSPFQMMFFQSFFSLLIVFPVVLIRRGIHGFKTQHPWLHLVRDIAGIVGFFFFYLCIHTFSLTNAIVLNNTGPLWIPFIIWMWLRIRMKPALLWGTLIGFAGVLLVLQPGLGIFKWQIFYGLISGLGMGITFVSIRLLNKTEGPFLILFYYFLLSSLVMIPFLIWMWTPLTWQLWIWFLLMGACMMGVQTCAILSLREGPAAVLSPIMYLAIVFSLLLDWIFWHHIPNWIALLGALLVIIGGTLSLVLARVIPQVGKRPSLKLNKH